MKKILFIALILMGGMSLKAQDQVTFEFSDGIDNPTLKSTMERQISALLTAINRAESHNSDINFSGVNISDPASMSLTSMWGNVHFRTSDDDIVEHCLCIKAGNGKVLNYQVRNIAVDMKPINDQYAEDLYQEVCINLDKNGQITDFNIAMGLNQYMKIIREGERLNDFDRRLQILHWVEQFRNAYCQKDIQFMDQVFSEDALIITGKVMKSVKYEGPKIKYNVMDKQQYLANLRNVFARNKYVNVHFDDISVVRHGSKPNFYDVTLRQGWNSSTYSDEGIVFIVWDFTDEFAPKILVRTWQPMDVEENGGKVFDIQDFKLN